MIIRLYDCSFVFISTLDIIVFSIEGLGKSSTLRDLSKACESFSAQFCFYPAKRFQRRLPAGERTDPQANDHTKRTPVKNADSSSKKERKTKSQRRKQKQNRNISKTRDFIVRPLVLDDVRQPERVRTPAQSHNSISLSFLVEVESVLFCACVFVYVR